MEQKPNVHQQKDEKLINMKDQEEDFGFVVQQPVCADGEIGSGWCFRASWLTHPIIPRRIHDQY